MKIIHCSDLHLDSKIEGLPSEKSAKRREEIVRSFERLASYATQNSVRCVIIAGDMFDTTKITQRTRSRVINAIVSNPYVDFLYLSGNHEEDAFIASIDCMPENLKVFSEFWTSFRYDNVVISGIKLNKLNSLTVADNLTLSENDVNIVTMHGQVVSYKSEDPAEIIMLPKFKEKNVDYLALGHIHSYSEGVLDNRGKYAYSGCLDGRGFDETGEKGFVLLEVENGKLSTEFVPFSSRVLHEIEFNVEGYEDRFVARDELEKKLNVLCDKSDLIKVVLTGERKADFDMDVFGLTNYLSESFFFVKVYDKTTLKINIDDYINDKSVRGEFIRTVWESDLDIQTKQKVIMCGINAFKGEEI